MENTDFSALFENLSGDALKKVEKIRSKAIEKVIHDCIVSVYHKRVRDKDNMLLRSYMKDDEYNEFLDMNGKGTHWKYAMVTLNPRNDVNWQMLICIGDKICQKKWIKRGMGNIEWRNGKDGMHMHLKIIKRDNYTKNFSSVRTEIYNTCQHILGNKQHLNIKFNNGENDKVFDDYIMGIKKGEHKKNYDEDIKNRKEFGIDDPIVFYNTKFMENND